MVCSTRGSYHDQHRHCGCEQMESVSERTGEEPIRIQSKQGVKLVQNMTELTSLQQVSRVFARFARQSVNPAQGLSLRLSVT
jgi:hypothetical protein